MATMARKQRKIGEPHTEPDPNRWRARVKTMGRELYLGTFSTKEEAEAVEDAYWEFREARLRGDPICPGIDG